MFIGNGEWLRLLHQGTIVARSKEWMVVYIIDARAILDHVHELNGKKTTFALAGS